MQVNLIAKMGYHVGVWDRMYANHDSSIEEIISACMHGCYDGKDFNSVVDQTSPTKVIERVRNSVRDQHSTVAGFSDFIFEIRGISRACSHELVRHRTAWFLQQSQRYVNPVKGDDWYVIPPEIAKSATLLEMYKAQMKRDKEYYELMISHGIMKEDARFLLPNACKTNVYMKIDGKNLIHFLKLRMSPKAQWEIRAVAEEMYRLVQKEAPNLFAEDLQEFWW